MKSTTKNFKLAKEKQFGLQQHLKATDSCPHHQGCGSGSGRIRTFLVGSGSGKFSPDPDPDPTGTLAM